jgi:hypothetical protein
MIEIEDSLKFFERMPIRAFRRGIGEALPGKEARKLPYHGGNRDY